MFNDLDKITECAHIYKILFPSGKVYIGQSWNYIKRFKFYENMNCKSQPKLYNALMYYGFNSTEREIIDICYSQEELNEAEDYWINYYDSVENGYNCTSGGASGKPCEESRKKMSIAGKGRPKSEEHKRKIGDGHRGHKNANYGKPARNRGKSQQKCRNFTPEQCAEISERQRGEKNHMFGKTPHNKGIPMSEEQKEKLRKPRSKETKKRISIAQTGKKMSDEARRNMSIAQTGRKQTPETKEKCRLIQLGKKRTLEQNEVNRKAQSKITYKITTPQNEVVIIKNLKQYCIENNLFQSSMCAIANGKQQKPHRGYTVIKL